MQYAIMIAYLKGGIEIGIKEIIEKILDEYKQDGKRITKKDIADYLGISRQNFVNKLSRETFSPEELSKIAEKLECDLIFRNKEKEYKIKY